MLGIMAAIFRDGYKETRVKKRAEVLRKAEQEVRKNSGPKQLHWTEDNQPQNLPSSGWLAM